MMVSEVKQKAQFLSDLRLCPPTQAIHAEYVLKVIGSGQISVADPRFQYFTRHLLRWKIMLLYEQSEVVGGKIRIGNREMSHQKRRGRASKLRIICFI
jgi:hypothetical protein